jgi:hypothetical protein
MPRASSSFPALKAIIALPSTFTVKILGNGPTQTGFRNEMRGEIIALAGGCEEYTVVSQINLHIFLKN